MRKSINHIYLIILLSALSSVAPMGVDTYLPSIPQIAKYFSVSIEKIELSLSIFLIGFAIGQIFGGPISDRYGRRKGSIIGLLGFSFFSFLIIFSTNIYELWLYRFFEAFFGGIVVVNAAASVRDRFHGKEAAKVFSLMGMVRSLAPMVAPFIGAFIIHFYSWKAVFIFLTVYSLVVAFLVYKDLEESFTYVKQNVFNSFKIVLSNYDAVKYMLVLGLSFGGFFILISKSSFIYIEHYGISTDYFPLFFGINFVVLMALIRVNVSLLKSFTTKQIVKFALLVQIVSGGLFLLNHESISLVFTVVLIACYMGVMAFVFGNCLALAIEFFPKNAGVASSVIGVLQFGLGAIVSSISLSFSNHTFLPIAISITISSILAILLLRK
ncbi:multidrug effflux MFS transporter [Arcobacter roscoffensis]|uniref:Multidrug effflux MFS transporter n=1 Tax=Arcobacter roscoffensis TaxID=2961520 RepID=A0ABY5E6U1_9BACT|nr:multidrug effflux MFS transporter [Arcobacter roscoffensis]UTJ06476.1 multidrug effflux MFS transporter [Arcobacter roscoffensis]